MPLYFDWNLPGLCVMPGIVTAMREDIVGTVRMAEGEGGELICHCDSERPLEPLTSGRLVTGDKKCKTQMGFPLLAAESPMALRLLQQDYCTV